MKKFYQVVFTFLLAVCACTSVFAQCDPVLRPLHSQLVFNGLVYASAVDGNMLYVGGNFNMVGRNTGSFIGLDTATGDPINLSTWPRANDTVYTAVPDGSGGWFIGGNFSQVGTAVRNNLAHIAANGQVSAWSPNPNNEVRTLATDGTTLFVGGLFTSTSGQARNYIASYNIATESLTTWNPNATNEVYTIAVNGGNAYVGGLFSGIGGQTRNKIASIDVSTGLATAWNPNSQAQVFALAIDGTKVYAGGAFNNIGGQSRNGVACLDIATGLATTWNPNASGGHVYSIVPDGSFVYVGGQFTTIGSQTRRGLVQLNNTTGLATAVNFDLNFVSGPGLTYTHINDIEIVGNTLYAGGFTISVGTPAAVRVSFAAFDKTTGALRSLQANTTTPVYTLTAHNGNLFMGGTFSVVSKSRYYLAAVNLATDNVTNWDPSPNDHVYSLATSNNAVYVGGDFTNIGYHIAALDKTTGTGISGWYATADTRVTQIVPYINKLYLRGTFNYLNAVSRIGVGALFMNTGATAPWNPNWNGATNINDIEVTNSGSIILGGSFTSLYGQPRNRIAEVDTFVGTATAWNPNADGAVNDVHVVGNTAFVGGAFNNIGGQFRPRLASLSLTTGNAGTWNPFADNTVDHITSSGNIAYVTGSFANIGAQPKSRIAAIDTSTGLITPWAPNPNDQTSFGIMTGYGRLFTWGGFTNISNTDITRFAQYDLVATTPTITVSGTSTVCSGTSVTFTASTNVINGTIQWKVNNGNVGSGATSYSYTPANGDVVTAVITTPVGGCYTTTTATSNAITVTVNPVTTPTLSISGNNTICAGVSTTYTATTNVTGGSFQWKVNGVNVGTNTGTYSYTPANSDQVSLVLTTPTGCFSASSVTSSTINVTVTANVTPAISIAGNSAVCSGTSVTYTATTNVTGGTIQWKVNNLNVGTNSTTYSYTPLNNDVVTATITTPSGGCFTSSSATSTGIIMTVTPSVMPTVSISGSTTVCAGTQATYTATSNVTGATYQWKVNGTNAGTNSATYSYTPANNDQVSVEITVPSGCFTATSATSNVLNVSVTIPVAPTLTISESANSVCAGTTVTYTAVTNVTGGTYQWKVNGINAGTNTAGYSYVPLNNDVVAAEITVPSGACFTSTVATSNSITMVVQPTIIPTVSITGPSGMAVGQQVTINATVTNAGTAYSLNWRNNNVSFATTTAPTVNYTKPAGTDNITGVVTSLSTGCYAPATSNTHVVSLINSVNDLAARNIIVYPNPFEDRIIVKGLEAEDRVELYDMLGKRLQSIKVTSVRNNEFVLKVKEITPGNYTIRVMDRDGNFKGSINLRK